ncbi:hypothetical protein C7H19_25205 [Aphanothece hegewaldii CCALA 016]|uniref:Uncharacterized protein n=1 Tax=Aphanothece hegewaldii CCALA 016 TaxID=2107694 RepID=A0A2T1LQ95_9CHRO|nr:hypothetical protein [Aphanothece hegewaldii]PSF25884.1 hypothetical protein C7H19_25205 [Aphanothece hegewaldii CCALA 016]
MSKDRIDLSRGNGKTVLEQLLEEWDLDYVKFSKLLGFNRISLWQYRIGRREFRLSMTQIKTLEKMLAQVNLKFSDLPDDWILDDPENAENRKSD